MTQFDPYVTPQADPNWQLGLTQTPMPASRPASTRAPLSFYEQLGSLFTGFPSQGPEEKMTVPLHSAPAAPLHSSPNLQSRFNTASPLIGPGLFNHDWLKQQSEAGSAMGQSI